MREPEFWSHAAGPEAAPLKRALLTPVSWAYAAGANLRTATTRAYRPKAPVICVGNLGLGGTGKTPVAITLLKRLRARGFDAQALTRGYRGRLRGPVLVNGAHSFRDVGDEPLLLARAGPTWIAKSKRAGARAADRNGAEAIVMDDGFQNPSVAKDLSLVLIDAEAGIGNGRVVPAGPLRESAQTALRRADAVVVMGGDLETIRPPWLEIIPAGVPIIEAHLEPAGRAPGGDIFAFAGIGRPQKFFDMLYRLGAEVKATTTFPDHHMFTAEDLNLLRDNARRRNAVLLTTEKDHVRIPKEIARLIHYLPVEAKFSDEALLDSLIDKALARRAL